MNKLIEQQLQKIANPGESDIGGTQSPIVTQMATELLSLRAELAAIKSQKIVGYYYEMKKQNGDWVSRVTDAIPTSHDTEVSNIQALTFAP
ncbi:hypothetical protein [Yersinia canariae]|uniref:hypothetical protein n=1 Tax=Yersinia canariae TaxID=2607663 RepID=UPI0011A9A0BD|nr:hypothetical protein [Yersinia canariae]